MQLAAKPCAACGGMFTPPRTRHRACSRSCAAVLMRETKTQQGIDSARTRMWAKVDKTPTCWLWQGRTNSNGYGYIYIANQRYGVHRLSYAWSVGPIPDGLVIDHLCNVRGCVRPDHLRVTTQAENVLAEHSSTLARLRGEQVACIHGHAFTDANTYRRKNGTRACRTCLRERQRVKRPAA